MVDFSLKSGVLGVSPGVLVPNSGTTRKGPPCYISFVTVLEVTKLRSFGQITDLINC